MTKQIKVFFILLAFSAVVSIFSFFDIFTGVRSALLHEPIKELETDLINDADNDGLSDTDEAYWNTDFQNPDSDGDGFLDGEEVTSGYDPREPSNNELGDDLGDTVYGTVKSVLTDDLNLTDQTGMLVAGAISAGDITRDADPAKKDQYVDTLSFSVLDTFYQIQDNITTLPTITTIANSKENQVNYLSDLAQIIKEDLINFPNKLNTAVALEEQSPYFLAKSRQYQSSFDKAGKLLVPESWVDIHKNVLNLLVRLANNHKAIGAYNEDILKSLMATSEIQNINLEVRSAIQSVQAKISDEELVLDGSFYQILSLVYKE